MFSFSTDKNISAKLPRQLTNEVPKEIERGSMEETMRILQGIERVNLALGYTRRTGPLAFPRFVDQGYFYPRQDFKPEFLKKKPQLSQNIENAGKSAARSISSNPFRTVQYFYPTPYLQAPLSPPQQFISNKYFNPIFYSPKSQEKAQIEMPIKIKEHKEKHEKHEKLGRIVVLMPVEHDTKNSEDIKARQPKNMDESSHDLRKAVVNSTVTNKRKPVQETSLIDDLVALVPSSLGLGLEDDDEDEIDKQNEAPVTIVPTLPPLSNDKFLNVALKIDSSKEEDEYEEEPEYADEDSDESRQVPITPTPKSFNFSSPIGALRNFTNKFHINRIPGSLEKDPLTELENSEESDGEKSPFGPFGFLDKKDKESAFKEGGVIIQRLKVRRGGIAIAGPGGVATAGSGWFWSR